MLAPREHMAPINGEVVLAAGLYGENGYFISQQDIEWTLSQESVGQLVSADQGDHLSGLRRFLSHTPVKRDSGYAVTRTIYRPRILDRGTPDPKDDIGLRSGQTWMSVTSPSEGVSYVTVTAPDAENWDRRRKTAVIHWVDVRWKLPLPPEAPLPAGQPHTLTTLVTRQSGVPLKGWIVKYLLAGGGLKSLNSNVTQSEAEVLTDEAGVASLKLPPQSGSSYNRVQVQIWRPANEEKGLPAMKVGEGWTSVSWSAPDVQLRMSGPRTVDINGVASYQIEVSNIGDLPARQLAVRALIPPHLQFLDNSQPPPSGKIGNNPYWEIGQLAPSETRRIQMQCRPVGAGDGDGFLRVEALNMTNPQAPTLYAREEVKTRVFKSLLTAVLQQDFDQRQVGQIVNVGVTLKNVGPEPMQNVRMRIELDPGLRYEADPAAVLDKQFASLAAGAEEKHLLPLRVMRPGRLCYRLTATGDTRTARHGARAEKCVDARPAPQPPPQPQPQPEPPRPVGNPQFEIRLVGPRQARIGELVQYRIVVENTGPVPLENLRVAAKVDKTRLGEIQSTWRNTLSVENGQPVWTLPKLPPGALLAPQLVLQARCLAGGAALLSVDGDVRGAHVSKELVTMIAGAAPPANPPANPPAPQGRLAVTITETQDPVSIGDAITYNITLRNARDVPDEDIEVIVELDPASVFQKAGGPQQPVSLQPFIRYRIGGLRAREALRQPFVITVKTTTLGDYRAKLRVRSKNQPQWIERTETTRVRQ